MYNEIEINRFRGRRPPIRRPYRSPYYYQYPYSYVRYPYYYRRYPYYYGRYPYYYMNYPYYYGRYPYYSPYPYYPRRRRGRRRFYGMETSEWEPSEQVIAYEYPQSETPADNVIYPDYSNVDVGEGTTWPNKVFAPYVDATSYPPLNFADNIDELNVPYYNLGFIVSKNKTTCEPTWGTYYPAEEGPLNSQIKKIREMGGDILVSFGGATNVPLHVTAPDATVLKKLYKDFIKAYGLTRINFDIQEPWTQDVDSLKKNSIALKMLQDELNSENYKLEIWFTLPILPTGLTSDGLNVLRYALDEEVDIAGVNALTMNYGEKAAPNQEANMAKYGNMAITNLLEQLRILYNEYNMSKIVSQLWQMIGTTPMIGLNDVATEIFDLNDAKETLAFANRSNLGMISMWSLNRDKQCPGGAKNYVSISCSSILQDKYEFSSIFNEYNDLSSFNPSAVSESVDEDQYISQEILTSMYPTWNPNEIYERLDKITYKGKNYQAKWWTKGNDPSVQVANIWETPWKII